MYINVNMKRKTLSYNDNNIVDMFFRKEEYYKKLQFHKIVING